MVAPQIAKPTGQRPERPGAAPPRAGSGGPPDGAGRTTRRRVAAMLARRHDGRSRLARRRRRPLRRSSVGACRLRRLGRRLGRRRVRRAVGPHPEVGRVVPDEAQHQRHHGQRATARPSATRPASRTARRARPSSAGRPAGRSRWPAVSTPITSPRRLTNQRLAMVAAKTSAIEPVPRPISTPQESTNCQPAVTKTVRPLPSATSTSAELVTTADAEPVHQRGGERRGQPVQDQVDPDGDRQQRRGTSRTRPAAGPSARRAPTGTRRRRSAR